MKNDKNGRVSRNKGSVQKEIKSRNGASKSEFEDSEELSRISAIIDESLLGKENLDPIVKKVQTEVEILKEKRFNSKLAEGISILNKHNKKVKTLREGRLTKPYQNINKELLKNEDEKDQIKINFIGIFIMLFILTIIIYLFFEYGPIFGISLNKEIGINEENKINITATEEDIYDMYNNEVLIYSNQNISTYNNYGEKTWNYTLEKTFTPKIYIYNKYMIVSNNSTGNIYFFDNKKETLNKKIDGTIRNIHLDESGNFAVEYESAGYKENIAVFSKKGQLLYTVYLSNNSVIDIKMIENAKKIIIVKSENTSFKSGLEVSMVDSSIASGTENSNIKTIVKLDNNLLYDLTIKEEDIIMLLDNKITKCNINTGELKDIKTFTQGQMLFVQLEKDYYSYLEKPLNEQEDKYNIENIKFDNTKISSSSVINSPKLMKNSGLINYLIYQDRLEVINKWGIVLKDIKIGSSPKNVVIFNNEKSIALIYTNKIYIVNM